jgi:hypothetical protein
MAGLSRKDDLPLYRLRRFAQRFRPYQKAKSVVTNTSWFTPARAVFLPAPLLPSESVCRISGNGSRAFPLVIVDFYLHRL